MDNDYFLVPVNILGHDGPLTTSFPVENRLLPQVMHLHVKTGLEHEKCRRNTKRNTVH